MRVLTDVGAILPISDRRKLRHESIISYIHCATGRSLAQSRLQAPTLLRTVQRRQAVFRASKPPIRYAMSRIASTPQNTDGD
jgi:hypothetical protein